MPEEPKELSPLEIAPFDQLFGGLWDTVKGFFQAQFENVWVGLVEKAPELAGAAIDEIWRAFGTIEDPAWRIMLDIFRTTEIIDDDAVEELSKLKNLQPPFDTLTFFGLILFLTYNYISGTVDAVGGRVRQNLNSRYAPYPPQPSEIINAAFVAPEKTGDIRHAMKRAGLDDDDIDLLFLSRYRLYDESAIRELWLRGELTDDQLFERMRELGYTDTRIRELMKLFEVIPPVSDLLMMVAKEAFEPDIIQMIGLDEEFPEDQLPWMEKQGVSEFWARKYWYAHWDQPSIQQGFEMLHRGVIGPEELDILFRAVEIPRFWRDKLTQIAYQPFTRVDVRRMHALGVISDDELLRAYMDLGYDQEKAQKMVEFTVQYNASGELDLTKSQVLRGYKERAIPRDEAKELLLRLGVNEHAAEYLLDFQDFLFHKGLIDDSIDNIRERYVQNLISFHDARAKLLELNLPAAQIEVLLEQWELKRWKAIKVPSKSDLDKFLKARIINEDTYRQEMERLGYDARYTDWYLRLSKRKS